MGFMAAPTLESRPLLHNPVVQAPFVGNGQTVGWTMEQNRESITGLPTEISTNRRRNRSSDRLKLRSAANVFLCLVFCMVLAQYTIANESSPNILFILADDMGWNGTSVQMDPDVANSQSDFYQTPNLEALAARGMRFSNAYASPNCSPSRAAIQTGKSTAQLQLTDVKTAGLLDGNYYKSFYTGHPLSGPIIRDGLPVEEITIAEQLKAGAPNYKSAHVGKWHLHSQRFDSLPTHQGYDQLTWPTHPAEDPKQTFFLAEQANLFLEDRAAANEPFYMQLSFLAPHTPWEALASTLTKYQNLPPGARHSDPLYAAMTEDLDTAVGMVLDKLDQLEMTDNTYIVFASDNGATAILGADESVPLFHAKTSIFEGGVRVPMIAAGPGIQGNSISDVPVSVQDMFATVSDIAGVTAAAPAGLESASLLPLFQNGGELPAGHQLVRGVAENGELFFHKPMYHHVSALFGPTSPSSAVRDGDYKLVRIYGEYSAPDTILLFNLTDNLEESLDPNSPLNLADDMPVKTDELLAKLNNWLESVDASLPFNVADNIELHWNSGAPGIDSSAWRSTNNVDHYFRERWELNQGSQKPTVVSVDPHQPGLSDQAFSFDGDDGMTRNFFHVSDETLPETFDDDRSATFELWLKTDLLSQQQVLLETGDDQAGLSLSLGDGSGNGEYDELRFRVLGSDGQHLTVTSKIDRFVDPTRDFIQLVAVINDQDADRYVEIYVNGTLFGRADGLDGPTGSLDWDNTDLAGLGMTAGDALGGNGGSGDLPFSGGFHGEMALVSFYNHALGSTIIRSNYNSVLDPVDYGVHSVAGGAVVPGERPSNVSLNAQESSSLLVIEERSDTLDSVLPVDAIIAGPITLDSGSPGTPGSLLAGTDFTSYLLQFDPASNDGLTTESVTGSLIFQQEILAILFDPTSLSGSDALLGSIGDYGDEIDRGLLLAGSDFITISSDRRMLSFDFDIAGDELLQFRVITDLVLSADFNNDGVVDSLDLASWESAFGVNGSADADGDGDTDGADFLAWQQQVGIASTSEAADVAVPEPLSISLMALSALCVGTFRYRCQRATD